MRYVPEEILIELLNEHTITEEEYQNQLIENEDVKLCQSKKKKVSLLEKIFLCQRR